MKALTGLIIIGLLTIYAITTVSPVEAQFKAPDDPTTKSYSVENPQPREETCISENHIVSESMAPLLQVGDIVQVDYCVDFNTIEEGDIIVFEPDNPQLLPPIPQYTQNLVGIQNVALLEQNRMIMHRVVDIDTEEGTRILTTQGDNNDDVIEDVEDHIEEHQVFGRLIEVED